MAGHWIVSNSHKRELFTRKYKLECTCGRKFKADSDDELMRIYNKHVDRMEESHNKWKV